jgi:type II secretion system protein J
MTNLQRRTNSRKTGGSCGVACHSARAFTLLEILIAVAAFAIVLAAINTVFYSALRLRNRTTQSIEESLPVQQAVMVIKRDLSNLVLPGGTLTGPLQSTPTTSTTNTMSLGPEIGQISPDFFTTTAKLDETIPWSELQKVAYLLVEPTNRIAGRDLVRAVTRNLLPVTDTEPERQWLLSGVENVVFSYYDGYSWDEVWDSETEETPLPLAIKMEIELTPQDMNAAQQQPIQIVVPMVVEARTNTVAEAGEAEE